MDRDLAFNNTQLNFNYMKFLKFLNNNNVFSAIVVAILSERVNEITNTLTDNLLLPIINRDGDNDGVADIQKFENKKITLYNMEFGIGKIITALIKFFIICYLIFILTSIADRYIKLY